MSNKFRLSSGGQINRTEKISFKFNGKTFFGFKGDTLASALLSNGVHLVGRSFKYHRPRGIFASGVEETNALDQVVKDKGKTDPNIRATQIEIFEGFNAESQNCWPTVNFDVGAINNLFSPIIPAGFYYKTFMWPANLWEKYEHLIRKNIKGLQYERWNHAHGCRRWFNMGRDTSNDKIHSVYKMGEKTTK